MPESGCDIEDIVNILERRLPSRALAYAASELGISSDQLNAKGINDATALEKIGRLCNVRERIRLAVEMVLIINLQSLSTDEAFAFVDAEFRGINNPLTSAAEQLLVDEELA